MISIEEIKKLELEYITLSAQINHYRDIAADKLDGIEGLKNEYNLRKQTILESLERSTGQLSLRLEKIEENFKDLYEGKGKKELSKVILNFRKTTKLNPLDFDAIASVGVATGKTKDMISKWNLSYLKGVSAILPEGSFEIIEKLNMTVKIKEDKDENEEVKEQ